LSEDSKKQLEDREYLAGYKTGRDGDVMTRAVDMILDFARPYTTYGKGFQQGRSDRHMYGSRNSSTKNYPRSAPKPKRKTIKERFNSSNGRIENEPTGYLLITIPFFSVLTGWVVALFAGETVGTFMGSVLALYMFVNFLKIKEHRENIFEFVLVFGMFLLVGFVVSHIF
jgi:hypothetical protein